MPSLVAEGALQDNRQAAASRSVEACLARERSALGAAILDRTGHQAGILIAMLRAEEFLSSFNRAIYAAIKQLLGRGVVPLDYMAVAGELADAGVFEQYANAYEAVASLGEGVVLTRPMIGRIQEIQAAARQRALVKKTEELVERLRGRS